MSSNRPFALGLTLVLAVGSGWALASPLAAAPAGPGFHAQAFPETVGTRRDRNLVLEPARQLQERLAGVQAEAALARPTVVEITAAERFRIDYAGSAEQRDLPAGAELCVNNLAGQAFGPYTGRGPLGDGDLYTHTVRGSRILLQLHARDAESLRGFTVEELGVMGTRLTAARVGGDPRLVDLDVLLSDAVNLCSYNSDCVVNAACQSSSAVNTAKDAVAGMLFRSGGSCSIRTGGLVADTVTGSLIPYFLTAHHCIARDSEASSLETSFDYESTCNNPDWDQSIYNTTGDTVGATIKSTGSGSDWCLLQLASTPITPDGVATYLGWNSAPVANANNTPLYRISHPQGAPQAYSAQVVDTGKGTCRTLPRGAFIHSRDTVGATEGGSSGSPVVNGSGQIVGQLYGACGTNLNDVCDDASNATVDGAFANYYSSVAAFLDPGAGGGCSPKGASCTAGSQCCSGSCSGKPGAKVCK